MSFNNTLKKDGQILIQILLERLAAVRSWQHCNDETILAQSWSSSVVVPLSVGPKCGSLQQTNEQWTHVSMTLATISYCSPSWLQIYWHTLSYWRLRTAKQSAYNVLQHPRYRNCFEHVRFGFRRRRKTLPESNCKLCHVCRSSLPPLHLPFRPSVRPSVRPHLTTRLPPDGFSLNGILGNSKNCLSETLKFGLNRSKITGTFCVHLGDTLRCVGYELRPKK